jgi:hypothetical protein
MRTVVVIVLATSLGCGISPAEERARRDALAAEGRALELAADAVEARLLGARPGSPFGTSSPPAASR